MVQNLFHGLTTLGNGPAIAYLVGGSLIGMFIGVIPGLGGAVVLSIILGFIYHINITATFCLFLTVQAGSYFSASVTSILLNTPAHPEAFAVTLDGFPMAQRGEAGRALGISATSTCIGGLIGCAVLVGFIQLANYLPEVFHPPEFVALVMIALLLVGTLGTDAVSKALVSAGIGLIISDIGASSVTGVIRYSFGAPDLYSGIALVALALGLFAIPQMVLVFGTATTVARQNMLGEEIDSAAPVELSKGFGRQVIQGITETLRHWFLLVRAALIGVITGVIPGIGGFAANFMSYGIAQQTSKRRELFGTGIPEGIIAPEGSSLAKEAGGMVPIIGLGIPGSVGGALFLAALAIKGIRVGFGFTQSYPIYPYEMMWIIALGGLIGTAAGVLVAPWLARVTRVPGICLVPFIMVFSAVGAFVPNVSFFDVMEVLVFAVVGFVMRRLRYSLAAFTIGLVLGPTLEANVYLTHTLFPGASFLKRPLTDVLIVVGVAVLIMKAFQLRSDAKKANAPITEEDPLLRAEAIRQRERKIHPYPLLAMVATIGIVVFCALYVYYGATRYNFSSSLMPIVGGGLAGGVALWRVPIEINAYIHYRQAKREVGRLAGVDVVPLAPDVPGEVALVGAMQSTMPTGAGLASLALSNLATEPLEGVGLESSSRGGRPAVVDKAWGINGQYTREVVALAWFAGLVISCYYFDFFVGVPLFCALYGLSATGRIFKTWLGRIAFTVATAAVMWGVTYEILTVLHIVFQPRINIF